MMASTIKCWVVVYDPEGYSASPAICFPSSLCPYFDHSTLLSFRVHRIRDLGGHPPLKTITSKFCYI